MRATFPCVCALLVYKNRKGKKKTHFRKRLGMSWASTSNHQWSSRSVCTGSNLFSTPSCRWIWIRVSPPICLDPNPKRSWRHLVNIIYELTCQHDPNRSDLVILGSGWPILLLGCIRIACDPLNKRVGFGLSALLPTVLPLIIMSGLHSYCKMVQLEFGFWLDQDSYVQVFITLMDSNWAQLPSATWVHVSTYQST